jgi:hypothetical protein
VGGLGKKEEEAKIGGSKSLQRNLPSTHFQLEHVEKRFNKVNRSKDFAVHRLKKHVRNEDSIKTRIHTHTHTHTHTLPAHPCRSERLCLNLTHSLRTPATR